MSASITKYANLVTSEHADKPNFLKVIAETCQPSADLTALYEQIPFLYDVDAAMGQQLDVCGQWVGISRHLSEPMTGVYFALDTAGVGFDQGVWQGPFDPNTDLVSLPDEQYRILIKMRILNNQWDGTLQGAYTVANAALSVFGYNLFIIDHGNLSIDQGVVGPGAPDALVKALFTNNLMSLKPAGVKIANYIFPTAPGPIFAFDINNQYFAGFDQSSWASFISN